jgi:hypothetical protein
VDSYYHLTGLYLIEISNSNLLIVLNQEILV